MVSIDGGVALSGVCAAVHARKQSTRVASQWVKWGRLRLPYPPVPVTTDPLAFPLPATRSSSV
eukprot:scaffold16490_cov99-Isochrysis_galbana.AAC.4